MNDLIFSITLNNHTFNVLTNHKTTFCYYDIKGKYTASLPFDKNAYAYVKYKNVKFNGRVTKRDIWHIRLDARSIIQKKYSRYTFASTKIQQSDSNNNLSENITDDFPKNIYSIYNQLIGDLSEEYSYIDNKDELRNQLCEYIYENIYEDQKLDEIIEYENYEDVGPDEEPIIEKTTIRNELLEDFKNFLVSFRQAELDNKHKKSIITLENVIKEVPKLQEIPHQFLYHEFNIYLDNNLDELIEPNIYYNRLDILYSIGLELLDTYQYFVFMKTMEDKIDKLISSTNATIVDKDEIYLLCKIQFSKSNIPSDKDFKEYVTKLINDYEVFFHLYNKFTSLFNSDYIKLKWNEETIQLFQKYYKNELPVDPQYFAEYEVYKYIIPHYRKCMFRKNTSKFKPAIEQFPAFIAYASSILDILFKHNILIDEEECVIYNEDGDINSAYKEMKNIS